VTQAGRRSRARHRSSLHDCNAVRRFCQKNATEPGGLMSRRVMSDAPTWWRQHRGRDAGKYESQAYVPCRFSPPVRPRYSLRGILCDLPKEHHGALPPVRAERVEHPANCQRRSKIRPRGGAKLGHFGFTRDAGDERRPVSRALHVAGG